MDIKLKKIKVDKNKLIKLPVWYGFINTNKLFDSEEQLLDAIYNEESKGYHFFHQCPKPISKLVDFKSLKNERE